MPELNWERFAIWNDAHFSLGGQSNNELEQIIAELPRVNYRLNPGDRRDVVGGEVPQPFNLSKELKKEKTKPGTIAHLFSIPRRNHMSYELGQQILNVHNDLPQTYQFRDPKAYVGVEVEVENVLMVDPNITLGFWSVHQDGSLRNHGREFKTPPIQLCYLEPALVHLFKGLNPNIDFSKRTSIHFHFDMTNNTPDESISTLLLYTAVENLLFKFASLERRKNIFCVPITESVIFWKPIASSMDFLMQAGNYWHKYTAMNILPIRELGTFEYRHMPGTTNVRTLLIWADLLSRLRVYAYKTPLKEVIKRIGELNTSSRYLNFLQDVFDDLVVYLDTSSLIQDMEGPCAIVKNCSVANEFHKKVCAMKIEDGSSLAKIWKTTDKKKSKLEFTDHQIRAIIWFNREKPLTHSNTLNIDDCHAIYDWCKSHSDWLRRNYIEVFDSLFNEAPFEL